MTVHAQPSTKEDALELLLKQGSSSASTLAALLGISVQAMRRHLRSLQSDGLVRASTDQNGLGRPSNIWELTSKGQNHFNYGYEGFAVDLLSSLEANLSPEGLKVFLEKQVLEKGNLYKIQIGKGPIGKRMQKLVQLRKKDGHLSECHPSPDGVGWYINEFHCSIAKIAEQYPFVCDQELQIIRYAFPDCKVNRLKWRVESGNSCGFHIQPIHEHG